MSQLVGESEVGALEQEGHQAQETGEQEAEAHYTEEILRDFAAAELRKPSDETCHHCGRKLCVCELLSDHCYRCDTKPSENPNTDIPF